MAKSFSSAIVFTKNPQVLGVIKQDLKDREVGEVICPGSVEECLKALVGHGHAILILDWDFGATEAGKVLESTHSECAVGIRPVFMFAVKWAKELEGVAMEYRVSQLQVGEISAFVIRDKLNLLEKSEIIAPEIREGLVKCYELRKTGNTKGNLETLENLHKNFPDDSHVSCELAEAYLEENKIEESMKILEPFIAPTVKNPRALSIQGKCLLKSGKINEATIFLERASVLNPNNVGRLLRLGDAYIQLEKPERAKTSFKKALVVDPNSKQAKSGMGQSMLMKGEIEDALSFIRQLSGPAEMASVFNAAAIVSIHKQRLEDGINLYRTAVQTIGKENKPVLAKIALNMAFGYHRNKLLSKAYYFLAIATQLDPAFKKAKEDLEVLGKKVDVTKINSLIGEDLIQALLNKDFSKFPEDK